MLHLQRHGRREGREGGDWHGGQLFCVAGEGAADVVSAASEVLGVYDGGLLLSADEQAAGKDCRAIQRQRAGDGEEGVSYNHWEV